MFKSIILNRGNLAGCEVSLSTPRTATDSEGKEFTYYWATIFFPEGQKLIACTGSRFTELLGTTADDAKLAEVIKNHLGEYEVSQAVDEDGEPIYINDEQDSPLLKIQKVAHKVSLGF